MASYRETVIADRPSAYYRLGEGTVVSPTGWVRAEAGLGPDGDVAGPGTVTPLSPGALVRSANGAYTFNGTTQYLSFPSHAALNLGDVFTIEVWFKRSATIGASQYLFSKGANAYQVRFATDNQILLEKDAVGTVLASGSTFTDTNWHHLVATKNGAAAAMYIDGNQIAAATSGLTLSDTASALNVGRHTSAIGYFPGSLDEIALYKRALSAGEVKAHYNAGTVVGNMADLVVQVVLNGKFVNITEYVRACNSTRGRSYELDRFESGAADMTLLNLNDEFDPLNTSSRFYPYILPMTKVYIQADWNNTRYPQFVGWIERWPITWSAAGKYSEVQVTAIGAKGVLQNARFPVPDYLNDFGTWNNASNSWSDNLATSPPAYCRTVYADVTTAFSALGANLTVYYLNNILNDGLGRTKTDAQTNIATTQITSATAAFTQADVGRVISGSADIPANSYIASVTNATTIQINQNLTGTNSGQTIILAGYKMRQGTIAIPEFCGVGAIVDMQMQQGDIGCRDVITVTSDQPTAAGVCKLKGQKEMFVQDRSGNMLSAMLSKVGFSPYSVDTGLSDIVPSTPFLEGVSSYIESVADGELGQLFEAANGTLTFHDRARRGFSYSVSLATFGDGGGAELPYTDIVPEYDVTRVYNSVSVTATRTDAATQTVNDTASQTDYGYRPLPLNPPLVSDADALGMATYLLSILKDPKLRIRQLVIKPQALPATLWPQVLARDIPDLITVKVRPHGGVLITQDSHIEQIVDQITPEAWVTTWQLSPQVANPSY